MLLAFVLTILLIKSKLEAKLWKKHIDNLIVTVMHKKRIVGSADHQIDEYTFELLQEKNIIHIAANILRREILDIKKKNYQKVCKHQTYWKKNPQFHNH